MAIKRMSAMFLNLFVDRVMYFMENLLRPSSIVREKWQKPE